MKALAFSAMASLALLGGCASMGGHGGHGAMHGDARQDMRADCPAMSGQQGEGYEAASGANCANAHDHARDAQTAPAPAN